MQSSTQKTSWFVKVCKNCNLSDIHLQWGVAKPEESCTKYIKVGYSFVKKIEGVTLPEYTATTEEDADILKEVGKESRLLGNKLQDSVRVW